MQYSALLTPEGTFVDDCTVYRFDDKLMIVVNASNVARGVGAHRRAEGRRSTSGSRTSPTTSGLLAVQGPKAEALLQPLTATPLSTTSATTTSPSGKVAGAQCFISRTGYTGEDGFELYCRERDTVALWEALTDAGAKPIGLGARDSLRLEMGYALYGNEIDDTITPLEAGLGWIVKLDKGCAVHRRQGAPGAEAARRHPASWSASSSRAAGFPRHGYPVYHEGREVDVVRSGTHEPVARRRRSAPRTSRPPPPRPAPSSRSSAAASGCRPRW